MSEIEEAVERMRQYIETHLDQPISLVQLARVAGYSPYHTAHLFCSSTWCMVLPTSPNSTTGQ